MPKLVLPHIDYKDSFLKALGEFQNEGLWLDLDQDFLTHSFEDFVEEFQMHSKGRRLPLGYVPHTTFWILNDNDEFAGQIDLRHRINEALRKYGGHIGYEISPSNRQKGLATFALDEVLKRAKNMGLEKVLITCDNDNIASQKLIKNVGGILKEEISQFGIITQCYWVEL